VALSTIATGAACLAVIGSISAIGFIVAVSLVVCVAQLAIALAAYFGLRIICSIRRWRVTADIAAIIVSQSSVVWMLAPVGIAAGVAGYMASFAAAFADFPTPRWAEFAMLSLYVILLVALGLYIFLLFIGASRLKFRNRN